MPEHRPRSRWSRGPIAASVVVAAALLSIGAATAGQQRAEARAAKQGAASVAGRGVAATVRAPLVGTAGRAFEDPGRSNWTLGGKRPLRTTLWYPAREVPAAQHAVDTPPAFAANAPIADAAERYPLVLVSHGAGSRAAHMAWLAGTLAAHGYIVAAVDHNGSAEEELHSRPAPSDHFGWERALDLRAVLDLLLEDPVFGSLIDRGRIGAAGFSLGGTTVLWLAGARLDLDHLRRNAPPMPPEMAAAIGRLLQLPETNAAAAEAQGRAEQSHRDPRIRGVFALAPAMGFGFDAAGLRGIEAPVRIVVGRDDPVTPPATNARVFADAIAGAEYIELAGERGHFTPRTPDAARAAELAEVAASAVDFFRDALPPGKAP